MRLLFSILIFVFFTSCQQGSNSGQDTSGTHSTVELQEDVLNIGKMHCEMCVASIEKGLASVEGVEFVKVNLDDSTAVSKYDSKKANTDQFKEVIEKRGYVLKDKDLQP
jgi:copper chaperone